MWKHIRCFITGFFFFVGVPMIHPRIQSMLPKGLGSFPILRVSPPTGAEKQMAQAMILVVVSLATDRTESINLEIKNLAIELTCFWPQQNKTVHVGIR